MIEIEAMWDFGDPEVSEMRFRSALVECADPLDCAELHTQIARTFSLRRQFKECEAELDLAVALVQNKVCRASVRICLERGRCLSSSGKPIDALPWFQRARAEAEDTGEAGLEIDAIHMLAIGDSDNALEWNLLAVQRAEWSADVRARKWLTSLYNNVGWTYFETGDPDTALGYFERAVSLRESMGNPANLKAARWSIAGCMRELGRIDEALAIVSDLLRDQPDDALNNQEMALCLAAQGLESQSRPFAEKAWVALKDDLWMQENRAEVLSQLQDLVLD